MICSSRLSDNVDVTSLQLHEAKGKKKLLIKKFLPNDNVTYGGGGGGTAR
jgi:hypothetical protein